ncbi:YodC family protein [Acinetobacter nosocomialis]|uniref:YodC family protein n=1 Tax=Acinetobacter nosocomialis TaxID=106654 RepID=UPI001B827904|nr:DUF2158 domain-containing protein [Acinetobacter nosocomialis]MBR7693939.1 DUF2158 domain-containing protein [Acinetobacter nosocomialis]HCT5801646.1 DUF2158 domain-containing protein [Acinetobacter nosocomialis]
MSNIKAGDVVKLKSGGIPMTVERIRRDNEKAVCVWILDGEVKSYDFSVEALVIAN